MITLDPTWNRTIICPQAARLYNELFYFVKCSEKHQPVLPACFWTMWAPVQLCCCTINLNALYPLLCFSPEVCISLKPNQPELCAHRGKNLSHFIWTGFKKFSRTSLLIKEQWFDLFACPSHVISVLSSFHFLKKLTLCFSSFCFFSQPVNKCFLKLC